MLEKCGAYTHDTARRVYDPKGVSPCLPTMQGGGQNPKIITGYPKRIDGKRSVKYKMTDEVGTLLASQHKNGDTQPRVAIPVLTPERAKKRQNGRRFKTDGEAMFTLTAQDRHGVAIKNPKIIQKPRGFNKGNAHELAPTLSANSWQENNLLQEECQMRVRKLTPRECFRLQAFPDWAFDKAQAVNSNSQLYKQAGNSVTVSVIYEIAKRLR
jgi:DNA (cytosine-5)-methyltransferase 1